MSELDDLVRNQRFEEIHDARRQVIEDERSINEALATGRVSDSDGRRLFQRAVDAYVRELEYLLNPPNSDEANEYWHETEIGRIPLPNDRVQVVEGLGAYLDLPEELSVTVRATSREHYYELGDAETKTMTVQPPWRLLRSAFRTANAAVSGLGMELDTTEENEANYDYSDLLDEPAPNTEADSDQTEVRADGG